MKDNFKSGFAAIIGRPNVGKSTLMNHLIGQKDRDHIQETADDQKPYPDGIYLRRRADRFSGYSGYSQGEE